MNKKLLAAAVAAALVAPMSAQAIKFAVSGHVHRAIRFVDTGDVSDIQFTDDTSSRTRLRAVGSEDIGNGMKAGIYIEFGVVSNRSDLMDIKTGDGPDSFGADIRHSALWFGGNFGTLWMGQTSTASDGAETQNFVTGLSDEFEHIADDVASVRWRDGQTRLGIDMGDTHFIADGGRRDTLRYDTPMFGPVQLKVAVGNNEFWDIGAFAGGGLAGGKYKLAAGYSSNGNDDCVSGTLAVLMGGAVAGAHCEKYGGSAGFMFSQGTSIQGTYSKGEADDLGPGRDVSAEAFAVKLGHAFGNNEVSVSYGQSQYDLQATVGGGTNSTELQSFGGGFQHNIKKAGVTIHANYHRVSLDLNQGARTVLGVTSDPDDVDIVMVGARVQFK